MRRRLLATAGLCAISLMAGPAFAVFTQPIVLTGPGSSDIPVAQIRFETAAGQSVPVEKDEDGRLGIVFPGDAAEAGVLVLQTPQGTKRIAMPAAAAGTALVINLFNGMVLSSPLQSAGLSTPAPTPRGSVPPQVSPADDALEAAFQATALNRDLFAALDAGLLESDPVETEPSRPDIPASTFDIAAAAAFSDLLENDYVDQNRIDSAAQYIAEIRADPAAAVAEAAYARQQMAVVLAEIESRGELMVASANAERWGARVATVRAMRAYEREAMADGVLTPEEAEHYETLHDAASEAWAFTPEEEAALQAHQVMRDETVAHIMNYARFFDGLNEADLTFLKNANETAAELIDWQNVKLPVLGEVNLTMTGETAGWMRDRIFNAKASLVRAENIKLAAELVMKDAAATAEQKAVAADVYQMADMLAFAAEDDIALGMAVTLFGTSADFLLLGLGAPINATAKWLSGGIRTAGGRTIGATRTLMNRIAGRTTGEAAADVADDVALGLEQRFMDHFLNVTKPKALAALERLGLTTDDLARVLQDAESTALLANSPVKTIAHNTVARVAHLEAFIERALKAGVRQPVIDDILARSRAAAGGDLGEFLARAEAEFAEAYVSAHGGRIVIEGGEVGAELFERIFGRTARQPGLQMDVENGLMKLRNLDGSFSPPSSAAEVSTLREVLHLAEDGVQTLWQLDFEGALIKVVDEPFLDAARSWLAQQSDNTRNFFAQRPPPPPPGGDPFSRTLMLTADQLPAGGTASAGAAADNALTAIEPFGAGQTPSFRSAPTEIHGEEALTAIEPFRTGQAPSFRSAPTEVLADAADEAVTAIEPFRPGQPAAGIADEAVTAINPVRPVTGSQPPFFNAANDDLARMIDDQLAAPRAAAPPATAPAPATAPGATAATPAAGSSAAPGVRLIPGQQEGGSSAAPGAGQAATGVRIIPPRTGGLGGPTPVYGVRGEGRVGLDGGTTGANIEPRLRFNFDTTMQTDGGLTFGGRIRLEAPETAFSSGCDDFGMANDYSPGYGLTGGCPYSSYTGTFPNFRLADGVLQETYDVKVAFDAVRPLSFHYGPQVGDYPSPEGFDLPLDFGLSRISLFGQDFGYVGQPAADFSPRAGESTYIYAAGLELSPVRDIRFRGAYQRAVRAPNVTDLFILNPGADLTSPSSAANCPYSPGSTGAMIGSTPMVFAGSGFDISPITRNCLQNAIDLAHVEVDLPRTMQQARAPANAPPSPTGLPTVDGPGVRGAIVAIIDSGIDWRHPDFDQRNLWWNSREIPGNGLDDDGNGFIDDIIGWNFVADTNIPWDRAGHGTFVAGQIVGRQGSDIAGINPDARIMVLKAVGDDGETRASYIVRAIAYAVDNGAQVINLSVGGTGVTRAEQVAIDYANSRGVLVVVAAGNENIDVATFGPAAATGVLTVAATDAEGRRAPFSNAGARIDIAAPGVEIAGLRAQRTDFIALAGTGNYQRGSAVFGEGNRYYRASGTSFSAPQVAGVASLILTRRPDLDAQAVRRMILQTATDIETPGRDQFTGYGLLNPQRALAADPAFQVEAAITAAAPAMSGARQVLRVTGSAEADRFGSAWLELGAGESPTEWRRVGEPLTRPVSGGVVGEVDAGLFSGSAVWTIRLITEHADGTRREARYRLNLG